MPIRRLEDTFTGTSATIGGDELAANTIAVKPHIQPGTLCPAVAGKLLDGSTSHSGAYGTAQSDGKSYYYTDIKGSKPIKDPRIGAHFGSQRHKITSMQLLEQETATHGCDVFSFDGREYFRFVQSTGTSVMGNDGSGVHITLKGNGVTGQFMEIVGYFNQASVLIAQQAGSGTRTVVPHINGGSAGTASAQPAVATPLGSRFVSAPNLSALTFQTAITTPGINTLKLTHNNSDTVFQGVELIAQDTTSTANKSKIQIPSQNVVSYGKKFTVSGTPHYNPFAFAGDGTTAVAIGDTTSHGKVATGWTGATSAYFDSTLDTATSLGLSAWETGGDFYRPVNGGRVVRWVDSSGNIKTSVNMMPPCATAITAGSDASLPTSHAWTTVYQPKIKSGSIDHSQAEVAKTFNWREFGNGAANGGTGASGNKADASMLNATDAIAYVMDDGLTSLSAESHYWSESFGLIRSTTNKSAYMTFIGTGLSFDTGPHASANGWNNVVQNLPYGTHILKIHTDASNSDHGTWKIDGVTVRTFASASPAMYHQSLYGDISFHQPKMPPIPEDAVVIADYMLMADFVPQTTAGLDKISKGTRSVSPSRDFFIDDTGSNTMALDIGNYRSGFIVSSSLVADSDTTITMRLPAFATNYVSRGYQHDTRHKLFIDTTDKDSSATKNNSAEYGSYAHLTSSETLGVQKWGNNVVSGQYTLFEGFDIATPIHTSSHYSSFETPYLHELVGGDRNMEQTNLVVTADGKSWDEVTRDTSYIGNTNISTTIDVNETSDDAIMKFDEWRGALGTVKTQHYNKDFAISYDRVICLVDGHYEIHVQTISAGAGTNGRHGSIKINGVLTLSGHTGQSNLTSSVSDLNIFLKRGDYVQVTGKWYGGSGGHFDIFQIKRIN